MSVSLYGSSLEKDAFQALQYRLKPISDCEFACDM